MVIRCDSVMTLWGCKNHKEIAKIHKLICQSKSQDLKTFHLIRIDSAWWRHQMKTFSALLALCAGNSPVTGKSPHKGQWRGALVFPLICTWINTLKRKCCYFDEIFITGCTESCHFDNFQCSKWWRFRQNDDISVSVTVEQTIVRLVTPLHSLWRHRCDSNPLRRHPITFARFLLPNSHICATKSSVDHSSKHNERIIVCFHEQPPKVIHYNNILKMRSSSAIQSWLS